MSPPLPPAEHRPAAPRARGGGVVLRGAARFGEWCLLALPLLVAGRLRWESEPGSLDLAIAVDLFADIAGPALLLAGVALGPAARWMIQGVRGAPTEAVVAAGGRRMGLLLLSALLSFLVLAPPALVEPQGASRRLLGWVGAGALPAWGTGLFLVGRDLGLLRASLGALVAPLTILAAAAATTMAFQLGSDALILGSACGGLLWAATMRLAISGHVPGPPMRVAAVAALAAAMPGIAVTAWAAEAARSVDLVIRVVSLDLDHDRVAVQLLGTTVRHSRLAEVDLAGGPTTLLSPLATRALYPAGRRVEVRRSRWAHSLGVGGWVRLCAEPTAGEEPRCGPRLPGGALLVVNGHPSLPWVAAVTGRSLLAWNFETGQVRRVRGGDGPLRWPCFERGEALLWRDTTGEDALRPMRLDLADADSRPVPLDLDHDHQCADDARSPPVGRFVRGRVRVGKPSTFEAPGLPEGGIRFASPVAEVDWSDDGRSVAFLFQAERGDPGNLGLWSSEAGLAPRRWIEPSTTVSLSSDGRLLANLAAGGRGRGKAVHVRSMPDAAPVAAIPADGDRLLWDGRGRLLLRRDFRLLRWDPVRGEEEVLLGPSRPPVAD